MLLAVAAARHHVAADGIAPLPRLAVGGGRHAHHRVVGGVGVDGDDAAAQAARVAAGAAVALRRDAVVRRLGAAGAAARGGAALRGLGRGVGGLLGHGYHLEEV